MELTTLSTTVRTTEIATTDNAQYDCVVTRTDGVIQSVIATVNAKTTDESGNTSLSQLGQLTYTGKGYVSFGTNGFPMTDKTALYLSEFSEYISYLKSVGV